MSNASLINVDSYFTDQHEQNKNDIPIAQCEDSKIQHKATKLD